MNVHVACTRTRARHNGTQHTSITVRWQGWAELASLGLAHTY
jgi:hypothetical protein